jgi:hypothetical protein
MKYKFFLVVIGMTFYGGHSLQSFAGLSNTANAETSNGHDQKKENGESETLHKGEDSYLSPMKEVETVEAQAVEASSVPDDQIEDEPIGHIATPTAPMQNPQEEIKVLSQENEEPKDSGFLKSLKFGIKEGLKSFFNQVRENEELPKILEGVSLAARLTLNQFVEDPKNLLSKETFLLLKDIIQGVPEIGVITRTAVQKSYDSFIRNFSNP